MSYEFTASTQHLLRHIGWEGERCTSADDERYLLHRIVMELSTRTYRAIGEERYLHEPWPVEPALETALRRALEEHAGRPAAHDLAHYLRSTGATDRAVITRLHPTDRMIHHWIEQRWTAADVAGMLREAGIITTVADKDLARLDAWIANPRTAINRFETMLHALLDTDGRVVHASVRDNGFELHHDALFAQLLASAMPKLVVDDLVQVSSPSDQLIDVTASTVLTMRVDANTTRTFSIDQDPQLSAEGVRVYRHDGRCAVRFTYAGRAHEFFVESEGTWMDADAVLDAVDAFMADIGRAERVFQFAATRCDSGEYPLFLVADPARFVPLAARLGIPLHERARGERRRAAH